MLVVATTRVNIHASRWRFEYLYTFRGDRDTTVADVMRYLRETTHKRDPEKWEVEENCRRTWFIVARAFRFLLFLTKHSHTKFLPISLSFLSSRLHVYSGRSKNAHKPTHSLTHAHVSSAVIFASFSSINKSIKKIFKRQFFPSHTIIFEAGASARAKQRNNLMNFPVQQTPISVNFDFYCYCVKRLAGEMVCEFVFGHGTMLWVSEFGIEQSIVLVAETNQAFLEKKNRAFCFFLPSPVCAANIFRAKLVPPWNSSKPFHAFHCFVFSLC